MIKPTVFTITRTKTGKAVVAKILDSAPRPRLVPRYAHPLTPRR